MTLVPTRPPGPNARKARAFAAEILQLRAQGYTFEAIREALAGAGVQVSNSTVQREVARAARHPPVIPAAHTAADDRYPAPHPSTPQASMGAKGRERPLAPAPPAAASNEVQSTFAKGPSGKDVAEAFMATQISNPFVRAKEQR